MDGIISFITWVQAHLADIAQAVAYIIAAASVIVKLTPTLKDDNALKGVVKFLGKWIALDKYGPDGQE